MNRRTAKLLSIESYDTGKPCTNGHLYLRQTNSGKCIKCLEDQREFYKGYHRKYRADNSDKIKTYVSEKSKRNRIEERERLARWRALNRRAVNEKARNYAKKKLKEDPIFKIKVAMRSTLKNFLLVTGQRKSKSTEQSLGYTAQELKSHIELNFLDGMSWDNRDLWHIDHIKPMDAFLKDGIIDIKVVHALSNLQPLWAHDNLVKGSKYK